MMMSELVCCAETEKQMAKEKIAAEGYDPDFGARPLRRLIQREIQDPLALQLLKGEIKDGDAIEVDAAKDGETFAFKAKRKEVAGAKK